MALTDGLRAYYKLNQGALTTDSSGNGYTLTNTGSVAEASDGKFNYCADYGTSGTTKSLSRSDALSLGTGDFTINMWVKYASTPAYNTYMCSCSIRVKGTKTQHEFDYRNVSGTLQYNLWTGSTGGTQNQYKITESVGVYIMLTFVYDNGTLYLYRNNTQIISIGTSTSTTAVATTLKFGNKEDNNRQVFGKHDEIAVYNRVLTSDERAELYNGGAGKEISLTSIKSINGLAYASVKSVNGLAVGSIKSINSLE